MRYKLGIMVSVILIFEAFEYVLSYTALDFMTFSMFYLGG